MGRFRLDPARVEAAPAPLRTGIALHHRSDALFHRHPWFTTRLLDGRQRLEADGVGRGPARAVAHVGPELLLDGALGEEVTVVLTLIVDLLDGPWGRAAEALVVDRPGAEGNRSPVGTPGPTAWAGHLHRVGAVGLPTDNHDPVAVGHRLGRILARRGRLRMEAAHHGAVVDHLRGLKPGIDASAPGLLDDLASALAG